MKSCAFVLAASAAVHAHLDPRPTLDEWKAGKAKEADAAKAAAADKSKMSAVDKVVNMLTDLRTQVMSEGEKEAQTYNKFACFCKDTSADKTEAIKKGTDEKAELSATIASLANKRKELDGTIDSLLKDIETAEKAVVTAKAERAAELQTYEKNNADLVGALHALEGAIKSLKSSKKPSLAQLQAVQNTLRTATLMADALGLAGAVTKGTAASLLQAAPDVPMEDYKFHSSDIISSLEVLLKDFRDEKADVDAEEVKAVAAFDALVQAQTNIIKQKNVALEDAKKSKAQKQTEIESNSAELSTVSAVLLDDQAYLKELADMCSKRAQTWDQRSKVRSNELTALTAAIGIVQNAVAGNTSSATMRFAQTGATVRMAEALVRNPAAMEAVEAEAETIDAGGQSPSFLQIARRNGFLSQSAPKSHGVADDGRQAVAALLKSKGQQLKSALLTSLSDQVGRDPLGKVKVLIQELIDRLLKEAANEANQKGWCDKSLADAEQKRDYAATQVGELNAQMATLEGRRDTLSSELEGLAKDIAELEMSQNETTTLRNEEKAENAATTTEAEAGLSAVEQAMDILVKFYKTAAKESVSFSLAQRGPADDAPDAGFDGGEAYTGAQGSATGIVGMLEVIKSDFERTISETAKAEAQAEKDYLAFMTESGKSLAEKNVAHDQKTTQKDSAEEELNTADESLKSQMSILQTALSELMELKPACIDTGMSYAERVARREDERAALTKALCVLENYEKYGPDGASGASC
eukprot:TRINITY_DN63360_c0_g1_i1.p1 TRINITY_DN63360_c0_g1~~TRINITY_DN63360_c0_g1_i1.p1  ORF type:complete len:755 (+),score=191.55 TRINITY_DN63360_c0_g1_i1:48-2312(+)